MPAKNLVPKDLRDWIVAMAEAAVVELASFPCRNPFLPPDRGEDHASTQQSS